jgi:hypothetical protein
MVNKYLVQILKIIPLLDVRIVEHILIHLLNLLKMERNGFVIFVKTLIQLINIIFHLLTQRDFVKISNKDPSLSMGLLIS